MSPRWLVLLALGSSACSFPTDGVPTGDSVPDAGVDACVATGAELCDGLDNDCDLMTDEDFDLGSCDGPDDDLCPDDPQVCSADGSAIECSSVVGDQDVELCNGEDEDCDTFVDETFPVDDECDGPDADECPEGVNVCNLAGDGVDCTDTTGDTVETCNAADDDCDDAIDEDFNLPENPDRCGDCTTQCVNPNGGVDCNDGVCAPICSASTQDCDGNPVNGCENLDTNPVCATAVQALASISGDTGAPTRTASGSGEAFFSIVITEDNSGNVDLRARVRLTSSAGANYDLTVRCAGCDGAVSASSNSASVQDQVQVTHDDAGNGDFTLIVEVRLAGTSQSACSPWSLQIAGNVGGAPDLTCH